MTAISCASLSTFDVESGSPGPAAAIGSPLTEPLVEFRREVESTPGEAEYVMWALTATGSASEVVVETQVWNTWVEDRRRERTFGRLGRVRITRAAKIIVPEENNALQ